MITEFPRRQPRADGGWALDAIHADRTAWRHPSGILVLSAVEFIKDTGAQWHVSVSYRGGRAPEAVVAKVRTDFDMAAAEEDNHVPGGRVRNFWLPCNRDVGACECKGEVPHVEPFGGSASEGGEYVWREVKR